MRELLNFKPLGRFVGSDHFVCVATVFPFYRLKLTCSLIQEFPYE